MMQDDRALKVARAFIEALPHAAALNLRLEEVRNGRAVIIMPYDARLVGDPATGVLHGGAISALMDTASGASVMCHPEAPVSTATLDLRIDYFRPATPGQPVTARAECHMMAPTADPEERRMARSKSTPGHAAAIAHQWGDYVTERAG